MRIQDQSSLLVRGNERVFGGGLFFIETVQPQPFFQVANFFKVVYLIMTEVKLDEFL